MALVCVFVFLVFFGSAEWHSLQHSWLGSAKLKSFVRSRSICEAEIVRSFAIASSSPSNFLRCIFRLSEMDRSTPQRMRNAETMRKKDSGNSTPVAKFDQKITPRNGRPRSKRIAIFLLFFPRDAKRCGRPRRETMDDPELEAIRQRRMQEMMAQRGGGGAKTAEQQQAQEEQKREADERRQMMLARVLLPEARERLSRIALVKPDKARGVEDLILRSAQMGQLAEKVSEDRLIQLLEQINEQTTKTTRVTIQRRRSVLDED